MYPTIYHFFFDWFGWDIPILKMLNSFGFFVALAFIFGSWTLSNELKRKEELGFFETEKRKIWVGEGVKWSDVLINFILGFVLGWKFIWLLINASDIFVPGSMPQEHIFSRNGYPLLGIVIAMLFGAWKYREYKKNELPEPVEKTVLFHKYEYTGTLTIIAALFGITGAKFFHLFENPDEFFQFFRQPSLENFLSGLTIYGGLICGGIAVVVYARRKKIKTFHLIDAAAPGMILAYGIGRIGCHVSGDGDWGVVNTLTRPRGLTWLPDWLWSYVYPNNVNAVYGPQIGTFQGGYRGLKITESDPYPIFEGYGTYLDPGVWPTAIYETIMALLIFGILWRLRKKIKIPGMIFAIYLMFNGLERFFIEKIRVNNKFDFLGLEVTQAEVISTLFFLFGALFAFWLWKKKDSLNRFKNLV